MNMAKIVNLVNVKKSYGNTPVLTNIDFSIEKGQLVVLLGPSGSGKTTLLNIIAGIDSADNGEVRISNHELTKMNDLELTEYRRDIVGYVFQFYNLLPNLTVLENAALGLELKGEDIAHAKVILEKIGLGDKSERFPAQLSGGEQQRVAIARAMAKNPMLIVADEPTGNLDKNNSESVRKLFKDIAKEATIIIATHDNDYLEIADKAYELNEGKLEEIK
jgi:putative ABC transport system ATP-binding protein|tara:strand:- start:8120 stop:8776 length:657 start_codon:yes stop_codon:yes gene_type:complete